MACKISDMIKGSIKVMMGIYISLLIVFFLPVKLPWKENHKLLIFILAISTSLWILSLILGRIESESAKKLCVLFLNIVAFTASIM